MVRKKNKMFVDSADRTPHYSLRKLSVGVASVLLSTTLWMGANGSVAHADTINDATVAGKVEDKLDPSETHKDQTQAQTAESTSQASVASAEKQNGEAQKGQAQVAVANANQAEKKQAQEGSIANAEVQTATANDAQADVEKQEPAAQSQQNAPQAQVSAPASVKEQASTAEGQTNGSANADAAIDATTEEKKDSANPEANSSAAATEDAKNESTTLDVIQAFKASTVAAFNKKMVMASLARTNRADSISENKPTDTTAVPGFSVTDPEYPSEMYLDPDSKHYTFLWVGQPDNGYQTVISTNRNGDGQIHVFELDQNNKVINSFDLDKNKSHTSWQTGVKYYNDEYAGLVSADLPWSSTLTLKYEVSGGKSDQPYKTMSFIVPRLNTQVTSYHDEDGNDITDKNGKKIEPVVQQGLDGQKYTTTGTKVIDGYYAKAPSNAQGTMSPYGKIGSTYEKNWHDGYSAVFTQTDNDGTMSVQMYHEGHAVNEPKIIKPGDIDIYSGVSNIYLRSIYVPQTTDIKYVYKKLGNTVLVDEDGKSFMGNTPTQYPNDPNDPTKAGKVVIPQYEGYTPKINGVPVGPDGFIPTDPGENTRVVYTANPAAALVRFIDQTEHRTLAELESTGKTGETIDFGTANAQLKSYLDRGYKEVANEIPT
ncbi:YSIRK-type signal peptide-containing protein, partial [Lactobacillus amylovorus]|uniref:YSIRK-type signal peptide-containing protein n=1 Tax=Lactobacillus amylovorus TaxID=1604 RepID=UPI0021A887BD